jgi:transcriptional regulator with XRE-family HTH domain
MTLKDTPEGFYDTEDFAKDIGVSFATVNRWETGKARPNLKTMKLIDDYCKRNNIDFDISQEIDE